MKVSSCESKKVLDAADTIARVCGGPVQVTASGIKGTLVVTVDGDTTTVNLNDTDRVWTKNSKGTWTCVEDLPLAAKDLDT